MKLIINIIFLFICLNCIQQFSFAQNQRFKSLSLPQGLSQSTVNTIIQDELGFIWIGTQDGLNKYDGHKFIHYKKDPADTNSLPDNFVQALYEDSKGNIWIGTYGSGVAVYYPKTNVMERINSTNSNLSDDIVMCFKEFKNSMYIGTKRGGLNKFDYHTTIIKHVETKSTLNSQIRDIEVFDENLYFISSKGGINFIKNNTWHSELENLQFQTLKKLKDELWVGGLKGELYYKKAEDNSFNFIDHEELEISEIWGITKDGNNNLWLGTFGGGVVKFNPKSRVSTFYKTSKSDMNSISHDVILSVFRDKSGGVWFGTLGGGINYFEPDNQNFKHYNSLNGLSNDVVMSFYQDNESLYVGTYGGGLNRLDLITNQFELVSGVNSEIVRCIFKHEDGNVWIGSYGNGLVLYNPKTKKSTKILEEIVDDVWCITKGGSGSIWIGTWGGGLINYNHNTREYTSYLKNDTANSISENTVISIENNGSIGLWVGTYGSGLNYFDFKKKEFTSIGFSGQENETNNKKIRSLYQDENSKLWIGTDGGGLNCLDITTKTIEYYTMANNLPNNVVYAVKKDKSSLWLTTNYGLSKFDIEKKQFQNYDYDDGLQDNEFNQGALLVGERSIYAGGINGFNVFEKSDFSEKAKMNKPVLTSMKVMGKEYSVPITYIKSIELNYSSNFLSFQMSNLDFSGRNTYRCWMEGLDKNWVYLNERNYINYTNLPAGKYEFKYQAKRGGEWGNDYSTLSINIPPPFWKTLWFYLVIVLFVCLGLYSIYVIKQRSLKRKNVELEKQVKIRTKEVNRKNNFLKEQKELIEQKHYEIQSSISYAKRIQNAILPSYKVVREHLPNSFVLYKPKDIVAGDFYWLETLDDKILFAAADCTGHGVPGAMVSVVCNNGLNRAVREYQLSDPGEILDKTKEIVIQEFEKSDEEVRDGMDVAICSLEKNSLQYAGAHNPLWIVRNGELIEIKANKQPIGRYFGKDEPFTTHKMELQKEDTIYIFSDGYADQFGGEKGKKLKTKGLKKLILSIQDKSMELQKQIIEEAFENWKGELEQIDDVCIIGVRV